MNHFLKLISIMIFPFFVGVSLPEPEYTGIAGHTVNPENLDGAFTGGFGEQTCRSCHFDYDLNMEGGSLTIEGFSRTYEPGNRYEVTVTIHSERLELGGFQMTARFEDGTQAGKFSWQGDRLMFTPSASVTGDVQYLQHSREGTSPTGEREIRWTFTWTAPEKENGQVIINVAANAGNNDDSSFGDWIYAEKLILEPDS